MSVSSLVRRTTARGQSAALVLLPHGGQRIARRNAWASMATDTARARARHEAALAMTQAITTHTASA